MANKVSKRIGIVGALFLSFVLLLAIVGPLLIPYDANEQVGIPFSPPSLEHWLGTNDMGQDIMAELAEGARVSLIIGIIAALFATVIGTTLGVVSGYMGGWFDNLCMRLVDITLTLPFLPLMIVIAVYLGPSMYTMIFVITLVMWAGKARQIRAQTLSIRNRGPVLAARTMGASHTYILRKHVLPSLFPIVIPQFVQAVNASIMMESSLSFLGMGDPLTKSWGSILYYANSRSAFLTDAWLWWVIPPGLLIVITVLAFSFMGYYLEERVNPRLNSFSVKRKRKNVQKEKNISAQPHDTDVILEVNQLVVSFPKNGQQVRAVNDVSFSLRKGEVLGLVGESGSGKTTIVGAIMQQLKEPAHVAYANIRFHGMELGQLSATQLQSIRGNKIALISQAAMNALNPVMTIKSQLAEAILSHRKMDKKEVQRRVDEMLQLVGLEAKWGQSYPHELSGGMKQRVIIAMALINEPELVIADEPTTGLDVKVQVEIVNLLRDLQKRLNVSMIFISHDLPVVLTLTDRLIIMKYGEIVDEGISREVANSSTHPYTRRLIDSIPKIRPEMGQVTPFKENVMREEAIVSGDWMYQLNR